MSRIFLERVQNWTRSTSALGKSADAVQLLSQTYTSFHPCGTCKMAPLKDGGVVDERLRVHGARNLRIVDASIFPVIPTGNLQAGVVMTAYKVGPAHTSHGDFAVGQTTIVL